MASGERWSNQSAKRCQCAAFTFASSPSHTVLKDPRQSFWTIPIKSRASSNRLNTGSSLIARGIVLCCFAHKSVFNADSHCSNSVFSEYKKVTFGSNDRLLSDTSSPTMFSIFGFTWRLNQSTYFVGISPLLRICGVGPMLFGLPERLRGACWVESRVSCCGGIDEPGSRISG